jgi:glutamate synthase domain-containing protein 2
MSNALKRRNVLRSISKEAHETIAVAMNRIGGKSNSG